MWSFLRGETFRRAGGEGSCWFGWECAGVDDDSDELAYRRYDDCLDNDDEDGEKVVLRDSSVNSKSTRIKTFGPLVE